MNLVKIEEASLTTHHIHLGYKETDTILSNGTGFIYSKDGEYYLITNWHNISGKNPITGECLSETLAIPDMLSTIFRSRENIGVLYREHIDFYADDRMFEPNWLEHPEHGHKVDVVALPIPIEIADRYKLFPINDVEFDLDYPEEVADEAFVVGYPFSKVNQAAMPIWKKASIATHPDIDVDSLPKMLIDTATRPGLSGSPVIMQRIGIHGLVGGQATPDTTIGRIRKFIGIYSGRIGNDEFKAQLGIVWKAKVIDEIIAAKVQGKAPSLM